MIGFPYGGWITAAGLFFLLLAIVFASSVVVSFELKRVHENDDVKIEVKALFGLIRLQWHFPILLFSEGGLLVHGERTAKTALKDRDTQRTRLDPEKIMALFSRMKKTIEETEDIKGWTRHALARVRLRKWCWKSEIGVGDAMWTAMTTGFIWSVMTTSVGALSQLVRLDATPEIGVRPVYNAVHFSMQLTCIAQIRLGYAILAGLHLLARSRKVKGGVRLWQNILFKA